MDSKAKKVLAILFWVLAFGVVTGLAAPALAVQPESQSMCEG
jgi:hypothetical protein